MKNIRYISILILISTAISCKKYVEVDPPRTELSESLVFANDKTASSAMLGVYSDMNIYNYYFANFVTMFMGSMSADDFTYAASFSAFDEFKNNVVLPSNGYVNILWSQPYSFIYRCNAIIEGVTASKTISAKVKDQLLGEAKFTRAFCYFYLVNIFGDVPLILNTDVLKNTNLPRTPAAEVYSSIMSDLKDAKGLLSPTYPGDGERIRPDKAVATLLLSRTYLYLGKYAEAETEATEVINNPDYALMQGTDIKNTFLKNSKEAVWQLQPVNTSGGRNTWQGFNLVPFNPAAPTAYYRLTKGAGGLATAFESGDLRKINWVGSYVNRSNASDTISYPYKYKIRTLSGSDVQEYSMVFRFAEAYLIRAESRIKQSKFSAGKTDLDIIRQRAGLNPLPIAGSIQQGMLQVEQERRVEFFAE